MVWINTNKCIDLTGGNEADGTSVSTSCFLAGINPLKALILFRLKFGTAMAVSTKFGMLVTPLVASLKPRKRSNTVQTTVEVVLILVRSVKLSGSSTYILFKICITSKTNYTMPVLRKTFVSGLLVRFYFTLVKVCPSS
jgi:hypothetical protein